MGRWRDVHRDQSEERHEDGRWNGNRGNDGNWNNTNRGNHTGGNGYGNSQNNGYNRGNNGNYGNGNGGDRNNNNGNRGNNGNNGNSNDSGNSGNNEDAGECKTHYEILYHRHDTLQQAFNIAATIENNRKVAGKIAKRDDPKLYNPRVPKKDNLTQIMDMHKDIVRGKNKELMGRPFEQQLIVVDSDTYEESTVEEEREDQLTADLLELWDVSVT
ncbi:uncharacterized protein LOC131875156 [Cryptomeria japonica]|uniref:uncharacterized protein LOC131875156 n=1 Tax=Cryptomeria japonica TaxID=3369 RepID=UPI0027DA8560|nr:uncharacterized protein LOC131875156 [Cryptomeria japonica]